MYKNHMVLNMKKILVLVFFAITSVCQSYEQIETDPFNCSVVDFNGALPGYGHFQPFETEPGSVPDPALLEEYEAKLLDENNQKVVFSSTSLGEVLDYCRNYAEANMAFMDQTGSCDLYDDFGELIVEGTWTTVAGEMKPKSWSLYPEFPIATKNAPWQMVYWQHVSCNQGGYEGEPYGHFPLPFVVNYDSARDCEEGCPVDNGVDAYDGSVSKSFGPFSASGNQSVMSTGAFAKMRGNFPLNFHYSTDVTSNTKPIEEVKGQWINANDLRMTATYVNPYTNESWADYDWLTFDAKLVNLWRPSGRVIQFFYYKPDPRSGLQEGWMASDIREEGKLIGANGVYTYTKPNQDQEYYAFGRLTKIRKKDGTVIHFSNNSSDNASYELVKGNAGLGEKTISKDTILGGYQYLIGYGNQTYQFKFDTDNRLLGIVKPTDVEGEFETLSFKYEDTRNSSLLTAVENEDGVLILSYEYDEFGRITETTDGEDAEPTSIIYSLDGSRQVNDNLGRQQTYNFEDGKISNIACPDCGDATYSREFDAPDGRESSVTDFNGTTTERFRDEHGLDQMVFLNGPDFEFSMSIYEWDVEKRLPTSVNHNGQITDYTYDDNGWLISKIENEERETTYQYDTFGNLTQIDGPRTDVEDITSFEYTDKGLTYKNINAFGQVTYEVLSFDDFGRPTSFKDANNLQTDIIYNYRGQPTSISRGVRISMFKYNNTGQLTESSRPDGVTYTYGYDSLGRLSTATDNLLNKISIERDSRGNLLSTRYESSDGQVHYLISNDYDEKSYISTTDNSRGLTSFSYDLVGNPISEKDGNNNETTRQFDGFNRLVESVDKLNGITNFEYDSSGNLTSVTDPEDRRTDYYYNMFDELEELFSPDTGSTFYTYDLAGNLAETTDSRDIETSYTYDALNRLTAKTYIDTSENVYFEYDTVSETNFGLGQLTRVTDETGSTEYIYNQFGEIVNVAQAIQGNTYETEYQYNENGTLTSVTYPSGRVIHYHYNDLGNVINLTSEFDNQTQTIASNISYKPFGPMSGLTYGNNKVLTQAFDNYYRLNAKSISGVSDWSYSYDLVSNIDSISNALDIQSSQSFTYDKLSRLLTADGFYGDLEFTYDGVGNRLSKTDNGATDDYIYGFESHHLEEVIGETARLYSYDEAGNMLSDGETTFTYNQSGRMKTAAKDGMNALYLYNFKGERSFKQVNGVTSHYIYDLSGQLIAEADGNGDIQNEYIYLNGQRIASIINGVLYYVHTNHLDTPIALTDESGTVQWKASFTPFGKAIVEVDNIQQNIRFPGQYYDAETELHYNYFRDYDPEIGRYVQSDPIGLNGGINTYGYVGGNPVSKVDPYGLSSFIFRLNPIARVVRSNLRPPNNSFDWKAAAKVHTKSKRIAQASRDAVKNSNAERGSIGGSPFKGGRNPANWDDLGDLINYLDNLAEYNTSWPGMWPGLDMQIELITPIMDNSVIGEQCVAGEEESEEPDDVLLFDGPPGTMFDSNGNIYYQIDSNRYVNVTGLNEIR